MGVKYLQVLTHQSIRLLRWREIFTNALVSILASSETHSKKVNLTVKENCYILTTTHETELCKKPCTWEPKQAIEKEREQRSKREIRHVRAEARDTLHE